MKKKGVEISIRFLVTIIIALIVFIFALTFAFRFFGQAEDYQRKVEQSTRTEIERIMINQGHKVAAYPTQIELYSGDSETIGLGIFSINYDSEKTFNLAVDCVKFINTSEREEDMSNTYGNTCGAIDILYTPASVKIEPNEDHIYAIYIKNDGAWRGTYILNAVVTVDNEPGVYGNVQKIYIKSK